MSVCELSVLKHLRSAAFKLNMNKVENELDINGMCERELASIINQHYQVRKLDYFDIILD